MARPVRELLTEIREWNYTADASRELAERVEAVLRILPQSKDAHPFDKGFNLALDHVRRALEGK